MLYLKQNLYILICLAKTQLSLYVFFINKHNKYKHVKEIAKKDAHVIRQVSSCN